MLHKQKNSSQLPGFTIVELLIVIVVIAILAAISIVAYTGITDRANASSASSAATQAAKKITLYYTENESYPVLLTEAGLAGIDNLQYAYSNSSNPKTFCITATSGSKSFYMNNTTVVTPVEGGCAGHGRGGMAAVTNLATNPSVELNGGSWSPRWYGSGGGAGTTSLTSAASLFGGTGYRKTWTTGASGQDTGFGYSQTVTAGKAYTFSAHVRASVAIAHRIFIEWYDASNVKLIPNSTAPDVAIPANTWQRLSFTATAPSNAVRALMVWGPYSTSSISGQTADFDGVMIMEGPTLYPYADGSMTNWIWNGTPHNSTSTGPTL